MHLSTAYLASLMTSQLSLQDDLVAAGVTLAANGLIAGTDGNISVRLDDGQIAITPAGLPKGSLSVEDLALVSADGHQLSGSRKPSSEARMHLHVYAQRPDVGACVHAHPPFATAFAVAGMELPEDVLPEVVVSVGPIPLTAYAPPGTEAVPQALDSHLANADAFLLKNHGVLTVGRSLTEAMARMEAVEHLARVVHLAGGLGNIDRIPPSDLNRLREMRLQKKTETRDRSGNP